MARRKPAPERTDPLITISDDERREWRKLRIDRSLTTRDLAKIVGTTHATITNIEVGTQRQAKRSLYAAIVGALYRVDDGQAQAMADEAVARYEAAFKRLVRALAGVPSDQVEAFAIGVEAGKARPSSKQLK